MVSCGPFIWIPPSQVATAAWALEDEQLASRSGSEIREATEETLTAEEAASVALRDARSTLALRQESAGQELSELMERVDRARFEVVKRTRGSGRDAETFRMRMEERQQEFLQKASGNHGKSMENA